METSNSNKKIYFSGDTAEIISDILKEYSLEETDEELTKKMLSDEDEPFIISGGLILETAVNLTKKETTEKDAIILLQKELGVSQTIAEKLIDKIKTKLVSTASTDKPVIKNNTKAPFNNIKSPIDAIKPTNKFDKLILEEKSDRIMNSLKKPAVSSEINESVLRPSEPDNYREPIE